MTHEPEDPTDNEIMVAIADGDSDALGALFDRHHRIALAVAYRVLGDHALAEDVVQEAFLAVWRRAGSFDPTRGAARPWLLTVVRNAAVDRRRGRHARALQDATLDDVDFMLASDGEEVFTTVAGAAEAARVRAALDELPAEQREAIELAFFGGLTHQEIAERTGAPLGTIKGRMRLGLHKLRGSLADLLPPDEEAGTQAPSTPSPRRRSPLARLLLLMVVTRAPRLARESTGPVLMAAVGTGLRIGLSRAGYPPKRSISFQVWAR